MAKFEFDKMILEDILDKSIFVGANIWQNLSIDYAPRIKESLPGNINLLSGDKPQRNIRKNNKNYYRKPVSIGGNYYEGVTGNLKRSIGLQKLSDSEYIIGVKTGPASDYAATHEFGDNSRKIPERSFLRRPLKDNAKDIINQVSKTFKELADKQ